jgi:ArsR family transcriptional regulator, lead/cadmium/zinc/bismuth-responsive transcriptional repressor
MMAGCPAGLWDTEPVHLLPAERSGHRVIDGERVCQAIAALGEAGEVGGSGGAGGSEAIEDRARRFALLGDPTRLALLTCIHAAGPISVSDLAAATGINDVTVSQTLRYLRAAQAVSAQRDGRVVRYQLASTPIKALLSGGAW